MVVYESKFTMTDQALQTEIQGGVATVRMNRPDVHNAFDDHLIAELTAELRQLDQSAEVRVVVLAANGKSFSAGADLNWMQRMAKYSEAENLRDAVAMAGLMRSLHGMHKPTIARVQWAAFRGGLVLIVRSEAGADSVGDQSLRDRRDRRARGAALFPHSRAFRRRGGPAHRPGARSHRGRAARRSSEECCRSSAAGRAERAGCGKETHRRRCPPPTGRCADGRNRKAHRFNPGQRRGARRAGRFPPETGARVDQEILN